MGGKGKPVTGKNKDLSNRLHVLFSGFVLPSFLLSGEGLQGKEWGHVFFYYDDQASNEEKWRRRSFLLIQRLIELFAVNVRSLFMINISNPLSMIFFCLLYF